MLWQNLFTVDYRKKQKNDGAVAGRGLSEVCYGAKYLPAKKKTWAQPFFLESALPGVLRASKVTNGNR
jgi:hypothetical protein